MTGGRDAVSEAMIRRTYTRRSVEFLTIFLRFLVLALYAVLLGRALWSWIDPAFRGPIGRFLYETTEPILSPIRRVLPQSGPFDWSILVALIGLTIISAAFGLR